MIKNIIFDFGAVLVDWNPHYLYDKYFGSREKADWFLQNICTYSWNCQMDGDKPWEVGVRELIDEFPEYEKEIRLYHDRWIDMMGEEIPGMCQIMRELRDKGLRLYGLTNWSAETFALIEGKYEFFNYLDGKVVSGREGVKKPDRRIFEILLDRFALKADECLFIDDSPANLEAAEKVKIKGVRFYDALQLREDLEEILI